MATSSFFNNVVIDTEKKFEGLVEALEQSERLQTQLDVKPARKHNAVDADRLWIKERLTASKA
jgi:hypothetical protein